MHAMAVAGSSTEVLRDGHPMQLSHQQYAPCRLGRFAAHFNDAAQEECPPTLPLSAVSYRLQVIAILLPVALQKMRKIRRRPVRHDALGEQDRQYRWPRLGTSILANTHLFAQLQSVRFRLP